MSRFLRTQKKISEQKFHPIAYSFYRPTIIYGYIRKVKEYLHFILIPRGSKIVFTGNTIFVIQIFKTSTLRYIQKLREEYMKCLLNIYSFRCKRLLLNTVTKMYFGAFLTKHHKSDLLRRGVWKICLQIVLQTQALKMSADFNVGTISS